MASGQKANREGVKSHPSTDHWIKALLSKALPTRGRSSFSHQQSFTSRNLHKSLSLTHQRADRRSKKKLSFTAAKIKTIVQKVNHNEKAEIYVPDKET